MVKKKKKETSAPINNFLFIFNWAYNSCMMLLMYIWYRVRSSIIILTLLYYFIMNAFVISVTLALVDSNVWTKASWLSMLNGWDEAFRKKKKEKKNCVKIYFVIELIHFFLLHFVRGSDWLWSCLRFKWY